MMHLSNWGRRGRWAAYAIGSVLAGLAVARAATGNPQTGYNTTPSYWLPYADVTNIGNSATPSAPTVNLTIAGNAFPQVEMDTGSRALYVCSFQLTGNLGTSVTPGYVNLTSSARVFNGTWYETDVTFPDAVGQGGATGTATANMLVLVVESVTAGAFPPSGSNTTGTTYGLTVASGNVVLADGSLKAFTDYTLELQPGEVANFTANPGMFAPEMNFGVGFDRVGVQPDNDQYNQQYDAFLNLTQMQSGAMVAGYVVTPTGVQLGLNSSTTGFAYTNLVPTGNAQVPGSPPDWQVPLGTITYGNKTYQPGQILVDTGVSHGILSLPGGPTSGNLTALPLTINLLNSGGSVSYQINGAANNWLVPTLGTNPAVVIEWSGSNAGVFSEDLPPFLGRFFNTGRNILNGFDFLYDATNGYIGLKLRPGATNIAAAKIRFSPGFYPNPVNPVAPFLYAQPGNQNFKLGGRATFAAGARGNPVPAYQWQMLVNGTWKKLSKGVVFQGVTGPTLQVKPTAVMKNFRFRVVLTSATGKAVSQVAVLKLVPRISGRRARD